MARLPNAQGTRADIVTLLKDSQYLATDAAESVISSVVSGALDKLHCEHDPCVRFDTQRKLWIYLHKGRTAEEFGRLLLILFNNCNSLLVKIFFELIS